jgi:beta-lactam-binding protein with PASTA domain/tRNA A-37 threonylcarbamoyl transferase component Bud32
MASSAMADLVGRVLAGRYRLLGSIGAGAGGRVYAADDVRLRRRVAVKVLHAGLSDDMGFLRRFRTEAQLAASLHHPNVMAVYDWGEDEGIPFMVLELLEGGSLRGMLDAGIRLTPSQAVHVGRQVAAALEYSHGRGLVHRDIKPANLLFDEHGIVRVADFGLARALAEASWTEPAGTVLGTARYASPEQGTAGRLDGRADLYALSLVLVESVTGNVPLVAESPLGTLSIRTEQGITAPAQLGALGPVIERAGQVSPDDRYPDAPTMAAALDDVARVLPPPGPFTLVGLGDTVPDPHPTQVVMHAPDAVFDQDESARKPAPVPVRTRPADDERPRGIAPFILGAVLILAVAGAVFALTRPANGATVTVPNLQGMNEKTAQTRANQSGLLVAFDERTADDPAGMIVSQHPASGLFLGRGGTVKLVVSKGPKPVKLPDVIGKSFTDAKKALEDARYAVAFERQFNETAPKDSVTATVPAGKAPPDTTVKVIVSDGPAPVTVPDVKGRTYDAAAAIIQGARLSPVRADAYSDAVATGLVIRTDPPSAQSVPRDSAVTIVVSKGPDTVVVPDLTGKTIDVATALAQANGLAVTVQGAYSPGKKVARQDWPKGMKVKRGTTVILFF